MEKHLYSWAVKPREVDGRTEVAKPAHPSTFSDFKGQIFAPYIPRESLLLFDQLRIEMLRKLIELKYD